MNNEQNKQTTMKELTDDVLDRINGGTSEQCKHWNRVQTGGGHYKCLDCGATW